MKYAFYITHRLLIVYTSYSLVKSRIFKIVMMS